MFLYIENMYERIEKYVLPKWKEHLSWKYDREESNQTLKPRVDTFWKKILRDVREFFRILFRVRFHYLDFKDSKGALKCVDIMFSELGIPVPDEYKRSMKLFSFIHQSHRMTNNKIFRSSYNDLEDSPFDVIEKYNEKSKRAFMWDIMWSRLFYFVFSNYLSEYLSYTKDKYSSIIPILVCFLLRWYNKMTENAHLERISYLLNIQLHTLR